jgi:hypothetical protein
LLYEMLPRLKNRVIVARTAIELGQKATALYALQQLEIEMIQLMESPPRLLSISVARSKT